MKEFFDKIVEWVKGHLLIAIGIAAAAVFLFFPKLLKLGSTRRRRRRISYRVPSRRRSYSRRSPLRVASRRRSYSRGGVKKKPWQIKGSLAARRRMALIRRKRRA